MPTSSRVSSSCEPRPRPATTSLTTTSHATTGPRVSAVRKQVSAASAMASSPSRSTMIDVSTAITLTGGSQVHRIARRAAAEFAHDVVGGHAGWQLEAPAHPRQRVLHILANHKAAILDLDLEL